MQVMLVFVVGFVFITALVWVIVPAVHGLPPVSSRPQRVRRALQMAGLQPGETLYDLGSGHGGVLVIAAKEFGANAVGVEVGPVQNAVAWVNAFRNGVRHRVRLEAGDIFKSNLGSADVVFAYLTSNYGERLVEKLQRELKPGARVVTVAFDLPGWEVGEFDRVDLIYLYKK